MKRLLLLSGIILMTVANPAIAWAQWANEPKDFNGIPFGASEDEARKIMPSMDCKTFVRSSGSRVCWDNSYNIDNVYMTAILTFDNNTLVNVLLKYKSSDFDSIKDVFIKKYGKQMDYEKYDIGPNFQSEKLGWYGEIVDVWISKYFDYKNSEYGVGFLGNKSYRKKVLEESEKKKSEKK